MIKYQTKKVIDCSDWDNLVQETYGKPYCFQQQNGCQERGTVDITIPSKWENDFKNNSIPEVVNGNKMGVSFKAWLEHDPNQPLKDEKEHGDHEWMIELFWERNFYPSLYMVANDLHAKGLIEAGEYTIKIDW